MAASGVWPMKEEPITDALLREFLLGKLAGEELERIESLYLTDSQTRDRVDVVEQDLIEDYLEDGLTKDDRNRFLSRYAQTDEQRRNLRITRSIRDWAITEASAPQTAAASVWHRLRTRLWLKPFFVVPVAAIILITIVFAIIWLNSRIEQRRHLAIEQELAQLNSAMSLREVPAQMPAIELRPVTVRSVEPTPALSLHAGIHQVELRLPWIQKERYSRYRAEVRRVGDRESYAISNLQPDSDGGNVIRMRLPASLLNRGQYQIYLSGVADDGSLSSPEEYSFLVSN